MSDVLRLVSVNLHSTSPGQAAATHSDSLRHALVEQGVSVALIARSAGGGLLGIATVLTRGFVALRRCDVLYVRSHPGALAVIVLARLARVVVVVEVNGTIEDLFAAHPRTEAWAPILRRTERLSLRLAHGVVTVTEGLADWVTSISATNRPVIVIPNGADIRTFQPTAQMPVDHPRPYVAFCGALAPWQGIDVLLAATCEKQWPADVDLLVAGTGSQSSLVIDAAATNPRIRHLGVLTQEQVAGIVANAVAVVSSNTRTRHHGSPMKLYEAIACGTPVVASNVPGQAEVVIGIDVGLVYEPQSSADLARCVDEVSHATERADLWRRNAVAARADVSWARRAEHLVGFLEGLHR